MDTTMETIITEITDNLEWARRKLEDAERRGANATEHGNLLAAAVYEFRMIEWPDDEATAALDDARKVFLQAGAGGFNLNVADTTAALEKAARY